MTVVSILEIWYTVMLTFACPVRLEFDEIFEETIWKGLYDYSLSEKKSTLFWTSNIICTQCWISCFPKELQSPFGSLSVIVTPLYTPPFSLFQVPSVQNQDTKGQPTHFDDTSQGTPP